MIYFKYLKILFKSALQYRASLLMLSVGQFFTSFFGIIGMALLFERFGSVGGWNFGEVALCFAVVNFTFGVTECFARGIDLFSRLVVTGDFDRILVRPRGTLLQVLGGGFELSRIGRIFQAALVLAAAIPLSGVTWSLSKAVTLALMILSGITIFTGVFILAAAFCFVTVEGLEVMNVFTYGGRELAQYPLSIYNKHVVRFFTFVIPFGCMNYLPLLYITGRAQEHPVLYMLSPLFGFLFLLPCLLVWRLGVGRYRSTGS